MKLTKLFCFINFAEKESKDLIFMETSALDSTNVESAFLEVLSGTFFFFCFDYTYFLS